MADLHVPIIHHHRKIVGWHTIGAHDDEVIDLTVADGDGSLDQIIPADLTVQRIAKANHRWHTCRHRWQGLARCRAPAAVVQSFLAFGTLGFTRGFQFFGCAVAVVGLAFGHQLVHHCFVAVQTLHLVNWTFVVIKTQPTHGFQNLVHRILCGAGDIGVFYAQHKLATKVACIGPGIQRSASRS